MSKKTGDLENLEDFSLSVGGPLYQLYFKSRMLDKPLLHCHRRMIIISMLTWLPLLILSLINGDAFGSVKMPFIRDFDVHVRLLVAISILIYAELIAHNIIAVIVKQFIKCGIITNELLPKYQRIISSAIRFRNSIFAELTLLGLVYTVGRWISFEYAPVNVSSWYLTDKNGVWQLTYAGYWFAYFSLPVFQFLLLRWYYRLAVWYRFLWQVSRLPLQLNSLHPDHAGGLGFLSKSIFAFMPFLLAHTILLSGMIFNRILNGGARLSDFQFEVIGILAFLIIITLLPMLFFIAKMMQAKRIGTMEYDVVASQYVNGFRTKWIDTVSRKSEGLLGTSDIQSLADLTNSFSVSSHMRITPFGRNNLISIVMVTALPLLPLLLTIIPVDKIINQLFGLIF